MAAPWDKHSPVGWVWQPCTWLLWCPVLCSLSMGAPGVMSQPGVIQLACSRIVHGLLHWLRMAWLLGEPAAHHLVDSHHPHCSLGRIWEMRCQISWFPEATPVLKPRTSLRELKMPQPPGVGPDNQAHFLQQSGGLLSTLSVFYF